MQAGRVMAIGIGHDDVHLLSPSGHSFAQSGTGWLALGKQSPSHPDPQAHLGKQRFAGAQPLLLPEEAGEDGRLLLWNSAAPIRLQLRNGPRPGPGSGCSEAAP